MTEGTASETEIEEYVNKINLLASDHLNDPVKLNSIMLGVQKNTENVLQEMYKKLTSLFNDFRFKISKLSLTNSHQEGSPIVEVKRKMPNISGQPLTLPQAFSNLRKTIESSCKTQALPEVTLADASSEPALKVEIE